MRKLGLTTLFLGVGLLFFAGVSAVVESKALNTGSSSIQWKAEKVTGSHMGTINVKSGNVIVEEGKVTGGEIVMDMNSIKVTDIADEDTNKKLVGHLKSKDFFDVAGHSEAVFKITKVTYVDHKPGNENAQVIGNLTIKGITKNSTFAAHVTNDNGVASVKGKMVFNRTMWDIKYGSGRFFDNLGDRMIYDDIKINFDVTTAN